MNVLIDEIFYNLLDMIYVIFFNGGWIILFVLFKFSSPLKSDYFKIFKNRSKITERKNRFIKNYFILLLPSWFIINLIYGLLYDDFIIWGMSLFVLPFTIFIPSIILISFLLNLKGILVVVFTLIIFIFHNSNLAHETKSVVYITIIAIIYINTISLVFLYYILLALMFAIVESYSDKKLFRDAQNNTLTFQKVIYRNFVKFICLYIALVPFIYYIIKKEILWDKITDTHYVSFLEE